MSVANYPTIFGVPALSKEQFNALSGQQHLPFGIAAKVDDPAHLTPDLIRFNDPTQKDTYVQNGQFTPAFEQAYRGMAEIQRRQSVGVSVNEGIPIVIETNLSGLPANQKRMVRHLTVVAQQIEKLYMTQEGSWQYVDAANALKNTDRNSYDLFWRNQGPWADAPKTSGDPFANALPNFPQQQYGIYPEGISADDKDFFKQLEADKALSSPWTAVVRAPDGSLKAVPYHVYFSEDMQAIATELDFAADALVDDKGEQALYQYLRAAADAFRNGDWKTADEKWCAMNMQNSKFALRVAPDETYWEPGNMKSAFQFWFARIDGGAVSLTEKLKPHLQGMENEFQALVPQYKARALDKMDVPDFIEMVLRSGDHRPSLGATIGEKLPNFDDSITRGVVMTNYYEDEISHKYAIAKANDLLVPELANNYTPNKDASTIDTLLHEATHSFGVQAANWKTVNADGTPRLNDKGEPMTTQEALGGTNSQVMEELKAQTGSLYWIGWLTQKGVFTPEQANQYYLNAVLWAFGHISRGMTTGDGSPRTYSQLAAIQIRWLMDDGAITMRDGKFDLHFDKFHATSTRLLTEVTRIQTLGDADAATRMRQDVVDGDGYKLIHAKQVYDLLQKYPTASFDLQITMDGETLGVGTHR